MPPDKTIVYCTGVCSYDERVALPTGVYSTLELAQASVTLREGEQWTYEARTEQWWVTRPGAGDYDDVIARYVVDDDLSREKQP